MSAAADPMGEGGTGTAARADRTAAGQASAGQASADRASADQTGRHGQLTTGRRQLTYAVLLCLGGAGLSLFAATRTWVVEVTARPAPLPAIRVAHPGGELLPWLSALAVVGLAAAGAVLASRGVGRRLFGGLLVLVGLGIAGGGGYGAWGLARGDVSPVWPVLCLVGGLMAAGGGVLTVARGHTWPAMGARYERAGGGRGMRDAGRAGGGPPAPTGPGDRAEGRRTTETWDALDRGEDPTAG